MPPDRLSTQRHPTGKPTDVAATGATVYFLPAGLRVPLKFGAQTVTDITCVRVRMKVRDQTGREAEGWGETPLAVEWSWPASASHASRLNRMQRFCEMLADAWITDPPIGHPLEAGYDFLRDRLPAVVDHESAAHEKTRMPYLAALVCASAFDVAMHDAYGNVHQRDIYSMYGPQFLSRDLNTFLTPAEDGDVSFAGRYPDEFLQREAPRRLAAWHLVGGLDPLDVSDSAGPQPDDGYPTRLDEWIDADGLWCLKVKLRGTDAHWDYERMVRVGRIAQHKNVLWLSADFNCTVQNVGYVNGILDRLRDEHPRTYGMILYVEQPFPYDLRTHGRDVRSLAARKPLFLDESAHDWQFVKLGRQLGWSGVALKTCKTQTGALLSLCWAKAHGMPIMVQDLTNPMLAQIPHVRLAAHAGTIMGVETNAMQFYPAASVAEARIHPGLYRRREGAIDLSTLAGPGFGYRLDEMCRSLPEPAVDQ